MAGGYYIEWCGSTESFFSTTYYSSRASKASWGPKNERKTEQAGLQQLSLSLHFEILHNAVAVAGRSLLSGCCCVHTGMCVH